LEILDRTEKQLVAAESATDLKNCCIRDFRIKALAVFSVLALLDKRQIQGMWARMAEEGRRGKAG
jgi:hypothetical protein